MWDTLTWPELRNEQVRDSAQELREQTLRRVLIVVAAAYVIWQLAATFLAPHQDAPRSWAVFPVVVMVAVVLMHPLAGLAVTAGSLGFLLFLVWAGAVAGVEGSRLVETLVLCLVTIVAASALGRDMLITTQWWLASYEQALRKTREAQEHRAQVVRAMGQLNTAYHRLQQANAALE